MKFVFWRLTKEHYVVFITKVSYFSYKNLTSSGMNHYSLDKLLRIVDF